MQEFVTIVSGLPRSGTSLMMQMLAAGGLPLLTDGVRSPDDDNPRGYFEFEPVKRTREDASWVETARGKAVKMVYLLLRDLPASHAYRVILMRRNMSEVLASQHAMLRRRGTQGAGISDESMAAIFEEQLQSTTQWLQGRREFAVLEVCHRQCLEAPAALAAQLNIFLGGGLNETLMSAPVDPALYRSKVFTRTA